MRAADRGLAAPTAAGGPEQLVDPVFKPPGKAHWFSKQQITSKLPANAIREAWIAVTLQKRAAHGS